MGEAGVLDAQMEDVLFRSMNEKERGHLYDLLAESYAIGYYSTLHAFSHTDEVAHLISKAREELHKLKRGSTYYSLLSKTGGKRYLEQYLADWFQQGKRDAHSRNLEDKRELRPRDIFYATKIEEIHPALSVAKKALASDNLGKVSFIVLFSAFAIVAIVALIGAYCYPNMPVFRKIQSLLE